MAIIHVILSGGVGSRLWPLSRKMMPKQYLQLIGGQSLFQLCFDRNTTITDEVVVVGNCDNYLLSREGLDLIKIKYSEIIEATPRNTAAAIAFAALAAEPDDILFITPSDHIITNQVAYEAAFLEASSLAKEGYLVTFGITPTKPETGYGYIEYDKNDVVAFHEKPAKEAAVEFLRTGRFLWNSGMFCFKAGVLLNELEKFESEILETSKAAIQNMKDGFLSYDDSIKIPSKSIDYAVMERSDKIKVVPADFGWSDLGSFEALWEHYKAEDNVNCFVSGNMVLAEEDKHVEFIGVENLIVIQTSDAILILPKDKAQDVKQVYEKIGKQKPELL
jgi:mannose-1-phosphate guanylyltransferase